MQTTSGRPNQVADREMNPAQHGKGSGNIALWFLIALCVLGASIYFVIPA